MRHHAFPGDPLRRYQALHAAFESHRRWFEASIPTRYASLTLATLEGDPWKAVEQTLQIAERIKADAGLFSHLKLPRFLFAAAIVRSGADPSSVVAGLAHGSAHFRAEKLRRGGLQEAAAVFLLMQRRGGAIRREDARGVREVYDEMKRHHWWLTGPEDYTSCAMLASERGSAAEICARIERFYRRLTEARFAAGDHLQRTTHLLYRHPDRSEDHVVARLLELRDGFREAGVRIWSCDWDELALLTFADVPAARIVRKTIANRDEMLALRPSVGRVAAFSLGASIAFLELAKPGRWTPDVLDAKWMSDYLEILAQQQAAAAAAT